MFFLSLATGATVEVEADGDPVENVPDLEVVATIAIAGECEMMLLRKFNLKCLFVFPIPDVYYVVTA